MFLKFLDLFPKDFNDHDTDLRLMIEDSLNKFHCTEDLLERLNLINSLYFEIRNHKFYEGIDINRLFFQEIDLEQEFGFEFVKFNYECKTEDANKANELSDLFNSPFIRSI